MDHQTNQVGLPFEVDEADAGYSRRSVAAHPDDQVSIEAVGAASEAEMDDINSVPERSIWPVGYVRLSDGSFCRVERPAH